MARSLIEQFSYAAFVFDKTDESDIFDVQPQALLKYLIPIYKTAGRAYGLMSKLAHYDPKQHFSFIDANDGMTIQRSWRFKLYTMSFVFLVIDIKRKIFTEFYSSQPQFEALRLSLGEPTIFTYDKFYEGIDLDEVTHVRSLLSDS